MRRKLTAAILIASVLLTALAIERTTRPELGVEAVHATFPSIDTRSPSSGTMTSSVAARNYARVSKQ